MRTRSYPIHHLGIECRIHAELPDKVYQDRPSILLLHGHSSSVAEVAQLAQALEPVANVYRFDQPCCGASEDVDPTKVVAALGAANHPSLVYLREVTAKVAAKIAAEDKVTLRVAGGSLGGNLALLLAERAPRYTWLDSAFAWSPGSAWSGDTFQVLGQGGARKNALDALGAIRAGLSSADLIERRHLFVETVFCKRVVDWMKLADFTRPQPWYWWYDRWGGGTLAPLADFDIVLDDGSKFAGSASQYPAMSSRKNTMVHASAKTVFADYTLAREAWHWQVAADELDLSHLDVPASSHEPRICTVSCPVLFMAGAEDSHAPANLHKYTKEVHDVALSRGVRAGGRVQWLSIAGTGHSLHNEIVPELATILANGVP